MPRSRPRFVPLLLSLLVFTFLAARLITALLEEWRSGASIEDAEPTTFAAADPRLDPDRYREPIERIERALYPTAATDLLTLGGSAARAGQELATRIRADGAGAAATEIASFANDLAGADLDAYGLREARDRWSLLRSTHFLDAPWLTGGMALGATDPALVGAYLDLAAEIDRVLVEAEQDGLNEAWSERLSALEARVPEAPAFGADSSLVLGFDELTAALASARHAAGDPAGAASWLREARDHLTTGNGRLAEVLP